MSKRTGPYSAAATDNLTSGWTTFPLSANDAIRRDLRALRARSRDRIRNDPYAHRLIGMVKANVIGSQGVGFQSRAVNRNGAIDLEACRAIEEAWRAWGRPGACDVTGRLSWRDIQHLAVSTIAEDGEVLVRLVRGPQAGPFGFQLQLIDAERLDVDYYRDLRGGTYVSMGVEFDALGRPLAYYITDPPDISGPYFPSAPRGRIRVPAAEIIHAFVPERIGQARGVPWLAPALLRLQHLDGYSEAALVNARTGASTMGFYYSDDGASPAPATAFGVDGEMIDEVEPGTFKQLPDGMKFQTFDPTYPNGELPEFIKAMLRAVASSQGVSYHGLSGDLESVNFSSIRAGTMEERDSWKTLQEFMVDALIRPVFEAWLEMALISGSLKARGRPVSLGRLESLRPSAWLPKRWGYVNPAQEMQANVAAIEHGLKSPSEIVREQGRDFEEVVQEIARDRERLRDAGILPAKSAPTRARGQVPPRAPESFVAGKLAGAAA